MTGHRYLNDIGYRSETRGTEPSQYPKEQKSTEIPVVAASEPGRAQTDHVGVVGRVNSNVETVVERYWEGRPKTVTVRYTKPEPRSMRT